MLAYIKFTEPAELMSEVAKEKGKGRIDQSMVRFTHLLVATNIPKITNLVAVATVLAGDDILRMECSCGALWANLDYPDAYERVGQIREEIEERCHELGLELGGGMFEEV